MDIKNVLFAIAGLSLAGLFGYHAYHGANPEWHDYQRTYYGMLADKMNDPKLAGAPLKIEQVWLPTVNNRADRCVTCHKGIGNPLFKDAPQPYTTHPQMFDDEGKPAGYILSHPFDKFGCTVCHEGEPQALTVEATHGNVHHLDREMLVGKFAESSCSKCHRTLYHRKADLPMAAQLMAGKDLFKKKGCGACHTAKQMKTKGTAGPELSGFGSKTELSFYLVHDFHHVEGEHTKLQWEWEHFKDPQKITPGNPNANPPQPPTIMPNFGLSDEETDQLTTLIMSFKEDVKEAVPMHFLSNYPPIETETEVAAVAQE
ncbi:MAG: c-type cytochrome [Nitrospirae bacterium]|nr:c-type cytochrome [Nitrospirota bacterium]